MKLYRNFYLLLTLMATPAYHTAAFYHQTMTLHTITAERYDEELHSLFVDHFFNPEDEMPFSEMIGKIIVILEHKEKYLDGNLKTKCIEVIKQFKKHQYDKSFKSWGLILTAPNLEDLLPYKTKIFVRNVPLLDKIRTLKIKLG